MSENFLKYTGLTYTEILKQIEDKIASDGRFANFRSSAIAKVMYEIFAGVTDLINYNIEREAEESYFDTSKIKGRAVLNARNLGYIVTRPIPAESKISIMISGDLRGKVFVGSKLQIPIYSKLTFSNFDFILKQGFTYTFTTSDSKSILSLGPDYKKTFTLDDSNSTINIVEGEIKLATIQGAGNPQVGQKFQSYRIPDKTFSDKYGSEDYDNFPITKIWVGDSRSDANSYTIDRRSLINNSTISAVINDEVIKCCIVQTTQYEDVEIKFGEGYFTDLGAKIYGSGPSTTFDNIYIQYLSTSGASANKTGIIGEKLTYGNQIFINGKDITNNIKFLFNANIEGGADLEDADSIKTNAPEIYYSLERLVEHRDYVSYLKSLKQPIAIKNALAWGEQDEINATGAYAIVQLLNIIMFSAIGSLYNLDGDPQTATYSVKTSDTNLQNAVLDDSYDEGGIVGQSYFNIYTKLAIARQLKEYITVSNYYYLSNFTAVSVTVNTLKQAYNTNTVISFVVSSAKYLIGTSITSSIMVKFDTIETYDDIATKLQAALRAAIDTRSLISSNTEQNSNYNKVAFPNAIVTWDSDNGEFTITFAVSDPCHISSFVSSNITTDLGLTTATLSSNYTNVNGNIISSKIIDVINDLNERSQITPKHIYVSPTIHNFKLTGSVYINQLFDRDALSLEVNNAIYSYMNKNADFNVPVFSSNLTNLINSFSGVAHSDITIEADDPVVPANSYGRTTFFHPIHAQYDVIDKYGANRDEIYKQLFIAINSYFNVWVPTQFSFDPSDLDDGQDWAKAKWIAYLDNIKGMSEATLADYQSSYKYTERTYIAMISQTSKGFMKLFYDLLNGTHSLGPSTDVSTKFQDTNDFLTVCSDIHKDTSFLIKKNMFDDFGNIAPQYTITTDTLGNKIKSYVKGGYTMGAEIVKLSSNLVFTYN